MNDSFTWLPSRTMRRLSPVSVFMPLDETTFEVRTVVLDDMARVRGQVDPIYSTARRHLFEEMTR